MPYNTYNLFEHQSGKVISVLVFHDESLWFEWVPPPGTQLYKWIHGLLWCWGRKGGQEWCWPHHPLMCQEVKENMGTSTISLRCLQGNRYLFKYSRQSRFERRMHHFFYAQAHVGTVLLACSYVWHCLLYDFILVSYTSNEEYWKKKTFWRNNLSLAYWFYHSSLYAKTLILSTLTKLIIKILKHILFCLNLL